MNILLGKLMSDKEMINSILKASEQFSRSQFINKQQYYVIPEKMAVEATNQHLIYYDEKEDCNRLTDKGFNHVWFLGVSQDCKIFIDRYFKGDIDG